MNQLSRVGPLANRYFGMRHGESQANVAGIIVSQIETDRGGDYGLSERGRRQALAAARDCGLSAGTVICSSDFARAWQTAQIVRERLGAAEVIAAAALRERNFGELEGTPAAGYALVWTADEAAKDGKAAEPDEAGQAHEAAEPDEAGQAHEAAEAGEAGAAQKPAPSRAADPTAGLADATGGGIETVAAVLDRAAALIADLERQHSGRDILLVSHGDTLAILQAGFLGMDPARHRSVPPFGTAEIRPLRSG